MVADCGAAAGEPPKLFGESFAMVSTLNPVPPAND